jgi:hypothetical protein
MIKILRNQNINLMEEIKELKNNKWNYSLFIDWKLPQI